MAFQPIIIGNHWFTSWFYSTPVVSGCGADPGGDERDTLAVLPAIDRLWPLPSLWTLPVVDDTDVLDAIVVDLVPCNTEAPVREGVMWLELTIPWDEPWELGMCWIVELGEPI